MGWVVPCKFGWLGLPGQTHAPGVCGGTRNVNHHLSLPESGWLGLLVDISGGPKFHLSTVGGGGARSECFVCCKMFLFE